MNSSHTVLKKITPPTCTLEIWGKKAALSRWANKVILKDLRFKLSFDDPRLLEIEPVTIKGDREELDNLYNSVLSYMDSFLSQSFATQTTLQPQTNGNTATIVPKGLVSHELTWYNSEGEIQLELSATQLYDLVSALESYKSEMAVLAELETKQRKSRRFLPMGLSAAGILLAVGLTTVGIRVANKQDSSKPIAVSPTLENIPQRQPQSDVLVPEVPEIAGKPFPQPPPNKALESDEILPPPPSVDSPKPPPNIPNPALYPPTGNLTIPPISSLPPIQQPEAEASSPVPSETDSSQVESTIAVEPQPPESGIEEQNAEDPIEKTEDTGDSTTERTELETAILPTETVPTLKEREQTVIPQPAEIEEDAFTEAEIEALTSPRNRSITDGSEETNLAARENLPKPTTESSSVPLRNPESKIVQLPQQREIEAYFQQKWQPPAELTRTLEYRLFLAKDGSLTRILPIGKAASIYLDRTGIPLMGEAFVSPLESDLATVRLLLSPDGEVKTFVE